MGLTRIQKVSLLCHREEREGLLKGLQELRILQFSKIKESPIAKIYPDLLPPRAATDDRLEKRITELEAAITFLTSYEEKGLIGDLVVSKVLLSREAEKEVIAEVDLESVMEKARSLEKRQRELKSRRDLLHSQQETLFPWKEMDLPLKNLTLLKKVIFWTGTLPERQIPNKGSPISNLNSETNLNDQSFKSQIPIKPTFHLQEVNRVGGKVFVWAAFPRSEREEMEEFLKEWGFERVPLEGFADPDSPFAPPSSGQGRPQEVLDQIGWEIEELQKEERTLEEEGKKLLILLPKLKVLYDYYTNLLKQWKAQSEGLVTQRTFLIEGWVRKGDLKRLDKFLEGFESVSWMEVDPYPGERPPVELRNRGLFKPFELVTELYGMPHHRELDPTPLFAPFFAIFFGLCLTDAGYGILLAFFAYLLLKKIQGGRRLFQLLLIGGGSAVVMGALTGGWFGDGLDRLPIPFLKRFILFRPMEDPITFFYIAFGLGYFQVLFGIFVKLYENIRERDYGEGLLVQVPWILLLNSLLLWLLSALGLIPEGITPWALFLALTSALIILLFSDRTSRNPLVRIALGAFALYRGTSYLGDVISYVRLVALGMVTGGLAMALNVFAGLAFQIPFIGFFIAFFILIVGHLFNLALNTLGAFVHTLRLQYVEFFPKFYQGSGRPFKPFGRESKYTYLQ
ncbi:V-type ATP synthase subunit I [candidate division TA06 bacterium]|nr:V-type ATP synthase subunit I [candidate division TA06 bacterium]